MKFLRLSFKLSSEWLLFASSGKTIAYESAQAIPSIATFFGSKQLWYESMTVLGSCAHRLLWVDNATS